MPRPRSQRANEAVVRRRADFFPWRLQVWSFDAGGYTQPEHGFGFRSVEQAVEAAKRKGGVCRVVDVRGGCVVRIKNGRVV